MITPDIHQLDHMTELVAGEGATFAGITDPNNRARIIELCIMGLQAHETQQCASWLEQIDISMTHIGDFFNSSDPYRRF